MRAVVIAALTLMSLLGGQGEGYQEAVTTRLVDSVPLASHQANRNWRWQECRFRHEEGGMGFTIAEVQHTIRCAALRWDVPGDVQGALCIAQHESGFNELNVNSSSSAAGVYQFLASTWSGVLSHQTGIFRRWDLRRSVLNARANVVAAIRIAHMGSWSPWTVRYLCGV